MNLDERPAGEWYIVVLTAPGFSPGAHALAALRGSVTVPVPELGEHCACCDQATGDRVVLSPVVGRASGAAIKLPVCATCRPHLSLGGWIGMGGGLLGICGVLAAGAGLYQQQLGLGVGGLVVAAVGGAAFLGARLARARSARGGHHRELHVTFAQSLIHIQTTNRRFAADVVVRNAELLRTAR